jgi:hypothetical protein
VPGAAMAAAGQLITDVRPRIRGQRTLLRKRDIVTVQLKIAKWRNVDLFARKQPPTTAE